MSEELKQEQARIEQEYIVAVAPAMIALMEANLAFADKYPETSAGEHVDEIKAQLAEWQGILDGPTETETTE